MSTRLAHLDRSVSSPLCSAAVVLSLGLLACGGGGPAKPSAADALKVAAEKDAADKKAQADAAAAAKKKAEEAKLAKKDSLDYPFTYEAVRDALPAGVVATYKRKGTDLKGKKLDQTVEFAVKKANDKTVGTTMTIEGGGANQPGSMLAEQDWSMYSPFFKDENPKVEVVGRESVQVPAGTFEALKAEVTGFFGSKRTVWIDPNQPGVYVKVVDHPNTATEGDKTNLTWELVSVTGAKTAAAAAPAGAAGGGTPGAAPAPGGAEKPAGGPG